MIRVEIGKVSDWTFLEKRDFESLDQCLETLCKEQTWADGAKGSFIVYTKDEPIYDADYNVIIYDDYFE